MAIDAKGLMQPLKYSIDLADGLVQQPMCGQLMKGDANANRVIVEIRDGNQKADLTGITVTGGFIRPPDEAEIPLSGESGDGEAIAYLNEACYAQDGYCKINVALRIGETQRTILSLTGHVLRKGSGEYVDIIGAVPNIDAIIAQYAEMKRVTQETQAAANAANAATDRVEQLKIDASGLAGDANRLGGKAPEYYLSPRNLLDNSNFEIAQAGYGGLHGTQAYVADRWISGSGLTVSHYGEGLTVTKDTSAIWYSSIRQVVDVERFKGKPVTVAAYCKTANRMRFYVWGYESDTDVYAEFLTGDNSDDGVYVVSFTIPADLSDKYVVVAFSPDCDDTGNPVSGLKMAMYPGTYTADNLPPYVPKGYAVEMAECKRYLRKINKYIDPCFWGYTTNTGKRVRITIPSDIEPATNEVPTITGGGTVEVVIDGTYYTMTDAVISYDTSKNGYTNLFIDTSAITLPIRRTAMGWVNSDLYLSWDL